jgi:hypothetical protein
VLWAGPLGRIREIHEPLEGGLLKVEGVLGPGEGTRGIRADGAGREQFGAFGGQDPKFSATKKSASPFLRAIRCTISWVRLAAGLRWPARSWSLSSTGWAEAARAAS